MADSIEVVLSVRVAVIRPWQRLFVVGSEECLGAWMPLSAKAMDRVKADGSIWQVSVRVSSRLPVLSYRYFIAYYLDPAEEGPNNKKSGRKLIVDRWECSIQPRTIHPNLLLTKEGRATRQAEDSFGMIDGRLVPHDGWLIHEEEANVFLRIHGKALKLYTKKDQDKQYRIKVVPFDVRFRERDDDSEDGISGLEVLPEFPSFSNTELSVLTRSDPIFGAQYDNGSLFRNAVDYLVFRTRTVSLEHLGFRVEMYTSETDREKSQRVGVAYALPATLPDTYGKLIIPLINLQTQRPIGQIMVDYMLARPLKTSMTSQRDSMKTSYSRHWKKRRPLEVGHRGCGSSYTKAASSRENTLHSLEEAGRKGADMVEFDVHLTKDKHAVVFHDFHVVIDVAARSRGKDGGKEEREGRLHEVAIKDLKLSQLHRLHFEHTSSMHQKEAKTNSLKVTPDSDETNLDHSPFPPLEDVLQKVDPNLGFNIEIKYPMVLKGGDHECAGYFERNVFCDVILNEVLSKGGDRRILFSSFDPDICTLLSQKQHRYPVLFLVVGATARYEPFEDIRSDCSRLAVNYAAGTGLLGVNFHSEELLKDRGPFDRSREFNLVAFVWGDDLNDRAVQQYFRKDLGVEGIIYDRIGEEEKRKNIFLVEREARNALFGKNSSKTSSPMGSRRSSLESVQSVNDLSSLKESLPFLSSLPSPRSARSSSPPSSDSSTSSRCLPPLSPSLPRSPSSPDPPSSTPPPRATSPRPPPRVFIRSSTLQNPR